METINFILALLALFLVRDMRGRVRSLESQNRSASRDIEPDIPNPPLVVAVPVPAVAQTQILHADPVVHAVTLAPAEPSFDIFEWLKRDWLLKIGVFFVLVACGWFVSYAFMEGWVGPLGRIMLGCILGSLILVFGWWRIQTYKDQGAIFLVLGSTIVLMTVFAARSLYGFFTPLSALALMFATSAFVACASAIYRHRNLAVVSVLLAGAAPLLVNSPTADYIGLFAYLFAVVLGALVIVFHTGYRELTLASFLVVATYSAPHVIAGLSSSDDRLLVFGYAFASIFFVANIIGMVRRGSIAVPHDTMLGAGNALLLLLYINAFVPVEWKSLMTVAWTLVFAVGSFMALWLTSRREPFFIYAGISIIYLATATAFELSGPALTIAFAIEAAVVTLLTLRLLKSRVVTERASVLFIGPILLSLPSIVSAAWQTSILHNDMLALVVVGLTLTIVGLKLCMRDSEVMKQNGDGEEYPAWQLVVGSFYGLALVWLCAHALLSDDAAVMFSLVVYVLCGVATYFYGAFSSSSGLKMYGAALLLASVTRLLLVDVWQMELPVRILTFFIIGGIFLGTAFIRKQQKSTTV